MPPFFRTALLIIAGLGAFALSYLLWFGPEARAGRRNWQNSYRGQLGMGVAQARRMMGPPGRRSTAFDGDAIYEYPYGPVAAVDIYFGLNSDSIVVRVGRGE